MKLHIVLNLAGNKQTNVFSNYPKNAKTLDKLNIKNSGIGSRY